MTTPTSEPLEPRAGDVWMKDGDVRQVVNAQLPYTGNRGTWVRFRGFNGEASIPMGQWDSWSATATRVWPPEQREGEQDPDKMPVSAAPADIAALLAEVRELREERDRLKAELAATTPRPYAPENWERVESVGEIVRTPGVLGGAARISGTRIPVWLVWKETIIGQPLAEMLLDWPTLTEGQLRAAIRYAESHRFEIETDRAKNEG